MLVHEPLVHRSTHCIQTMRSILLFQTISYYCCFSPIQSKFPLFFQFIFKLPIENDICTTAGASAMGNPFLLGVTHGAIMLLLCPM